MRPFRNGCSGTPVNLFALAFEIFMTISLPFPSFLQVTWKDMNYSGAVIGVVIIFALYMGKDLR